MDLNSIHTLWRQDDSMALWGIPYKMREGQSPNDIYRAEWPGILQPGERKATPRKHSRQVPEDWIFLGYPGWWGNISAHDQSEIGKFIAFFKAKDLIPGGPYEWCALKEEHVVWLRLREANNILINMGYKQNGPWKDGNF